MAATASGSPVRPCDWVLNHRATFPSAAANCEPVPRGPSEQVGDRGRQRRDQASSSRSRTRRPGCGLRCRKRYLSAAMEHQRSGSIRRRDSTAQSRLRRRCIISPATRQTESQSAITSPLRHSTSTVSSFPKRHEGMGRVEFSRLTLPAAESGGNGKPVHGGQGKPAKRDAPSALQVFGHEPNRWVQYWPERPSPWRRCCWLSMFLWWPGLRNHALPALDADTLPT